MTDSELPERPDADGLDALLAAYALDAVTEEEREIVETHLAGSAEARAELRAHRDAAAALAEAAEPIAPPPSMKASIMDRLDDLPQLPATAPAQGSAPRHRAPDVIEADPGVAGPDEALGRSDGSASEPGVAPVPPSGKAAGPVERAARRRWFQRPGAVIGAAAAAVLLIAGAVVGVNWPGPAGWGAQRDVQAIASAPDAQTTTVDSAAGGEVTLVWSEELGRSAVRASGLPDVGGDSTYELWYIDASGAMPAGVFDPRDGAAYVVLDGEFAPGLIVGVTIEPAGGSDAPTTDPIVVFET